MLRAGILILAALFVPDLALACSCANGLPIQQTPRYQHRAVFTARIVQGVGKTYTSSGISGSERVVAIVDHVYWGFPRHWAPIVILDGSYPCDTAMLPGREYLVDGGPGRYGVFYVNGCSRTQPLAGAQIDLLTLDGSHCSGPGGTLVGRVKFAPIREDWAGDQSESGLARGFSFQINDGWGKTYTTRTDDRGIFEFQHLPAGHYTMDSRYSPEYYIAGGGVVSEGVCLETPVYLRKYVVAGRLGFQQDARVDLVRLDGRSTNIPSADLRPDGRFYFDKVSAGDYLLVATVRFEGRSERKVYYPGVNNPEKAAKIHISEDSRRESLDFNTAALPLVSIPIIVDPSNAANALQMNILLRDSGGRIIHAGYSHPGDPISVLAVRGEHYELMTQVQDPSTNETRWKSQLVPLTAESGMKRIHLVLGPSH